MDADMSALLAARAWSVLTEWKVTSSAGRERMETSTSYGHVRRSSVHAEKQEDFLLFLFVQVQVQGCHTVQ
jgi:hypothetical protein